MSTLFFRSLFIFICVISTQTTLASANVTLEISHKSTYPSVITTTILEPNNKQIVFTSNTYQNTELYPGLYSILISQPEGAKTTSKVFIDGILKEEGGANIALNLESGQSGSIEVTHTYNRVGTVGVSSKPNGVPFILNGPNKLTWSGVTPMGYEDLPEGQYSLIFTPPAGCGDSKPFSNKLVKGGRINFTAEFKCTSADILQTNNTNATTNTISMLSGQDTILLEDVGAKEWYAPYIQLAIKGNIMNGYTNTDGTPTNTFGPNDSINLAQLSKIAHRLAGIDEKKFNGAVQNPRARNQWFESFYASAEQQYWLAFITTSDNPARNATRAEVVATIMQSLNQRRVWPTGRVFLDVSPLTKFADAIEAAAADGLIDSGDKFRPTDSINRAEMAKLVAKAIELYIK